MRVDHIFILCKLGCSPFRTHLNSTSTNGMIVEPYLFIRGLGCWLSYNIQFLNFRTYNYLLCCSLYIFKTSQQLGETSTYITVWRACVFNKLGKPLSENNRLLPSGLLQPTEYLPSQHWRLEDHFAGSSHYPIILQIYRFHIFSYYY